MARGRADPPGARRLVGRYTARLGWMAWPDRSRLNSPLMPPDDGLPVCWYCRTHAVNSTSWSQLLMPQGGLQELRAQRVCDVAGSAVAFLDGCPRCWGSVLAVVPEEV